MRRGRWIGRSSRGRLQRRSFVAQASRRSPLRRLCHASHLLSATHGRRNASRTRIRRSHLALAVAGGSHSARHGPNCPRCFAAAFPASDTHCHGNDMAPLDTACTNHMRNSRTCFSNTVPDQTPVYFGSRTCRAEAKGTYATVPASSTFRAWRSPLYGVSGSF